MLKKACLFLIAFGAFFYSSSLAALSASLIPLEQVYDQRAPLVVLLKVEVPKGEHIYWKNPGALGLPTSFSWKLPDGWTVEQVDWPTPARFTLDGITSYGYEGTVSFLATLQPGKDAQAGTYPLTVDIQVLRCGSSCIPEKLSTHTDVVLGTKAVSSVQDRALLAEAVSFLPKRLDDVSIHVSEKTIRLIVPRLPNMRKLISVQFFPENTEWTSSAEQLSFSLAWNAIEVDFPHVGPFDPGVLHILYQTKQGAMEQVAYELHPSVFNERSASPSYLQGIMEPFANKNIWDFILLGFLGGILLNVMPCVLPVIGLKVVHTLSSQGQSYRKSVMAALMYSLGILVAFWILVGLLFFLQRVNEAYGWGFQLQNPYFLSFLIILFITISSNLFGFFGFGYGFAAWAQEKDEQAKTLQKHAYLQPFFSGLLSTCVATPCTGPLLGAVIGFASLLSFFKAALLFTSIAIGMASPFVLIALIPPLAWILPKPGPWMETFKQSMGFLLLLSALWLVWVLAQITPHFSYDLLLLGALGLFFASWLFGKSQDHRDSFLGRVSFLLFLIFFVLGSMSVVSSFQMQLRNEMRRFFWGKELVWERYSAARLQQEVEAGRTVLVNGHAKWCLTCQANEIVFTNVALKRYLEDHNVVLLSADWTTQDLEITEWLRTLGRNGVPTIAVYKKGSEPVLLPELISPEIVKRGVGL